MRAGIRVTVQCASPLLRSVVARHIRQGAGLALVRLADVAGSGRPADRADVLLQVVRRPTARSMAAAGWAAASGLAVVLLAEGRSVTGDDLAEAGRRGITAVVPLEAVTGELLRSTIVAGARLGRDSTPAPAARIVADYSRLLQAAGNDLRWVATRRRP